MVTHIKSKTTDKEIPMKLLMFFIALAVVGLIGAQDHASASDQRYADMVTICKQADNSIVDERLGDRDAEHKCSELINEIQADGTKEVLWMNGTYKIVNK